MSDNKEGSRFVCALYARVPHAVKHIGGLKPDLECGPPEQDGHGLQGLLSGLVRGLGHHQHVLRNGHKGSCSAIRASVSINSCIVF